jgi:glycosyltransferase involved in cell wall biosynthesis
LGDPIRIVQLNLAYDASLATPQALLARYDTLTWWADAARRAGTETITVQRFSADADIQAGDNRALFVAEPGPGLPGAWDPCARAGEAVLALHPDVVHINGLMFPGAVRSLRRRLPAETSIVVQDHSGVLPRRWPWPLNALARRRWRQAFADVDACVFTDRALAERWHSAGLPYDMLLLELPPAGSTVVPRAIGDAARETGMEGSPAILWVGRLDDNKDPLTVLAALEIALPHLPDAHVWMIYGAAPLEHEVRERIAGSSILCDQTTLVGTVAHDHIAAWFTAADIFVSGSHHEGSGYSLIEAMACGVMPCVTNIPSFRALTQGHGVLWAVGDADACAAALVDLAARPREAQRDTIRRHYASALSWESIGARTVRAYGDLAARRRETVRR